MTAQQDTYLQQGALSDPGASALCLAELPDDVEGLCVVVQGLLIHDCALEFYGEAPPGFAEQSRGTLAVADRLGAILAANPASLAQSRPPYERDFATCRDFALLLCALLRTRGVPARVRCGFAAYFGPAGHFEDHWVCEYWKEGHWALADPQLDEAHRHRHGIDFDVCDLPRSAFHVPWRLWLAYRRGALASSANYGHGEEATGPWFIGVNLARDLLALGKREASGWDRWREAASTHGEPDAALLTRCDKIAALAREADETSCALPRDLLEELAGSPPY